MIYYLIGGSLLATYFLYQWAFAEKPEPEHRPPPPKRYATTPGPIDKIPVPKEVQEKLNKKVSSLPPLEREAGNFDDLEDKLKFDLKDDND